MTPWRGKSMYRVACTRKEASCILGNFFGELRPVCEKCEGRADDILALMTETGLALTGSADLLIEGHSVFTGGPAQARLTDYGFEFSGDIEEIARIRGKRCLRIGRAVNPAKEG